MFTDLEGSTRLWEEHPARGPDRTLDAMASAQSWSPTAACPAILVTETCHQWGRTQREESALNDTRWWWPPGVLPGSKWPLARDHHAAVRQRLNRSLMAIPPRIRAQRPCQ